jgi:hypothetical protein
MPQEIGEIYKSLVPSLSDDASIEKAFQMYHYGTASYNGNNAQPQSMERHLVEINSDITDIRADISNLTNVFIEETSTVLRPNVIVSENPTVIPLTIRGVQNQTAILQRWQKRNESGNIDVAAISNTGNAAFSRYVSVGSNSFVDTVALNVVPNGDDKGVVVKGVSGQTENLQEWQNNSGTVLASVDASGNVSIKNTTVTGDVSVSNNITVNNQSILSDVTIGGTLSVTGEITMSDSIVSTSDITANNITGNGNLSVIGSSSIHNLEVDGTINAFGTITASGDIITSGDFEGANISLTESLITAGDITATGILRGTTPNSGSTGGVRIIANGITNDNYLQFVDSADTSEVSHIKVNASGFFLSSNTEIDGSLTATGEANVLSPTGDGSVGVRQVYLSTGDPTASDGNNGDIWVKYI